MQNSMNDTCPTCGSAVRVVGSEQDKAREFPPRVIICAEQMKDFLGEKQCAIVVNGHDVQSIDGDTEYLSVIEMQALRAQDRAEVERLTGKLCAERRK